MENLEQKFEEFKNSRPRFSGAFRTLDDFWEAWHKFTGTTSSPFEVYELAVEDDMIKGEKESIERNERAYQHRANGRPNGFFRGRSRF